MNMGKLPVEQISTLRMRVLNENAAEDIDGDDDNDADG